MGFKLSATVSGNSCWNSVTRYPAWYKGLHYGFSWNVLSGNSFGPPCKTVYAGQRVGRSLTDRPWSNKINMYMVESSVWGVECSARCTNMFVHLWFLAGYARTCPGCDITPRIWPEKSSWNQLHCGFWSGCAKWCRVWKTTLRWVIGTKG